MANDAMPQDIHLVDVDKIQHNCQVINAVLSNHGLRLSVSAPELSRSSSTTTNASTPSSNTDDPSSIMVFGRKKSKAKLAAAKSMSDIASAARAADDDDKSPLPPIPSRFLTRQASFTPNTPASPTTASYSTPPFSPHAATHRELPHSSTLGVFPPPTGEPWPLRETAPKIRNLRPMASSYSVASFRPVGMQRLFDLRKTSDPIKTTDLKDEVSKNQANKGESSKQAGQEVEHEDEDDENDDDSFVLASSVDSYGSSFDEDRDVVFGHATAVTIQHIGKAKLVDIPPRRNKVPAVEVHSEDSTEVAEDEQQPVTTTTTNNLLAAPVVREKRSFIGAFRGDNNNNHQLRPSHSVRSLFSRGGGRGSPAQPATTAAAAAAEKEEDEDEDEEKAGKQKPAKKEKKKKKEGKWARRKQSAKAMLLGGNSNTR